MGYWTELNEMSRPLPLVSVGPDSAALDRAVGLLKVAEELTTMAEGFTELAGGGTVAMMLRAAAWKCRKLAKEGAA